MGNPELIERHANWLRCIVLLDEAKNIDARGVIFPDGYVFVRWNDGTTTTYLNGTAAMLALENRGYTCHSTDIEVPLC